MDSPTRLIATSSASGVHTKAWELGRRAYLNWAVGKMISSSVPLTEGGSDKMEGIEEEMTRMGGGVGMDILASLTEAS